MSKVTSYCVDSQGNHAYVLENSIIRLTDGEILVESKSSDEKIIKIIKSTDPDFLVYSIAGDGTIRGHSIEDDTILINNQTENVKKINNFTSLKKGNFYVEFEINNQKSIYIYIDFLLMELDIVRGKLCITKKGIYTFNGNLENRFYIDVYNNRFKYKDTWNFDLRVPRSTVIYNLLYDVFLMYNDDNSIYTISLNEDGSFKKYKFSSFDSSFENMTNVKLLNDTQNVFFILQYENGNRVFEYKDNRFIELEDLNTKEDAFYDIYKGNLYVQKEEVNLELPDFKRVFTTPIIEENEDEESEIEDDEADAIVDNFMQMTSGQNSEGLPRELSEEDTDVDLSEKPFISNVDISNLNKACSNPSVLTLEDYPENDPSVIKIYTYKKEGKFSPASCFDKEELDHHINSDFSSNSSPINLQCIYTTPRDHNFSGIGGKPTSRFVYKLPVNNMFISIGSFFKILKNKETEWFAIPLFSGKRKRVGNVAGWFGSSMNHGQIPGFLVYTLYSKKDLLNESSMRSSKDNQDWIWPSVENLKTGSGKFMLEDVLIALKYKLKVDKEYKKTLDARIASFLLFQN